MKPEQKERVKLRIEFTQHSKLLASDNFVKYADWLEKRLIRLKLAGKILPVLLFFASCTTPRILATSQHGTVIHRKDAIITVAFPVVVGPHGSNFYNHFYDPYGKYQLGDVWP